MMPPGLLRIASLIAGSVLLSSPLAGAAERAPVASSVILDAGNGRVLTLPGPAANVFVADSKVAEVRPASATTLHQIPTR